MSEDNKSIRKIKKGNKVKVTNEMNGVWRKYNLRWLVVISIWTFILTIVFSVLSEVFLSRASIILAFFILILIIFVGVISDMVGVAVAAADVRPFHAMAADKVKASKNAIKLIKNASIVSSFCNDVIGDICGIISGVVGASVVLQLPTTPFPFTKSVITIILAGFVASLTVGGKAIGKTLAIQKSQKIVYKTASVLYFVHMKIGLDIVPDGNFKK